MSNTHHEHKKNNTNSVLNPDNTWQRMEIEGVRGVESMINMFLPLDMGEKEVVETLSSCALIDPFFTRAVWQNMADRNREFFRAYNARKTLIDQIVTINNLLEKQAVLTSQTGSIGFDAVHDIASAPCVVDDLPNEGFQNHCDEGTSAYRPKSYIIRANSTVNGFPNGYTNIQNHPIQNKYLHLSDAGTFLYNHQRNITPTSDNTHSMLNFSNNVDCNLSNGYSVVQNGLTQSAQHNYVGNLANSSHPYIGDDSIEAFDYIYQPMQEHFVNDEMMNQNTAYLQPLIHTNGMVSKLDEAGFVPTATANYAQTPFVNDEIMNQNIACSQPLIYTNGMVSKLDEAGFAPTSTASYAQTFFMNDEMMSQNTACSQSLIHTNGMVSKLDEAGSAPTSTANYAQTLFVNDKMMNQNTAYLQPLIHTNGMVSKPYEAGFAPTSTASYTSLFVNDEMMNQNTASLQSLIHTNGMVSKLEEAGFAPTSTASYAQTLSDKSVVNVDTLALEATPHEMPKTLEKLDFQPNIETLDSQEQLQLLASLLASFTDEEPKFLSPTSDEVPDTERRSLGLLGQRG